MEESSNARRAERREVGGEEQGEAQETSHERRRADRLIAVLVERWKEWREVCFQVRRRERGES